MRFRVCKASAHGLGFLYPPHPGFDSAAAAPDWVVEAWEWILRKEAGLPCEMPPWSQLPAMMRFTITTSQVLRALQARQRHLPYCDRVKPFGFIQSPLIDRLTGGHPVGADPDRFTLIGEFSSNPADWFDIEYLNVHDGKSYWLSAPDCRISYEVEATSLGDVVDRYRWHPESKSLGPDGNECAPSTHGLLRRSPVVVDGIRYIGKETNRRWEQGEDISIFDSFTLEYLPNETEKLTTDPDLQRKVRERPIRALAKASGLSTKTVKAARQGKRLRKTTIVKLEKALREFATTQPRSIEGIRFRLDDPE